MKKSPKLGLFYPKTCEIVIAHRTHKLRPHARTSHARFESLFARTWHVCMCEFYPPTRRLSNKCHIHIHQNTQIRNDVFELNVLHKQFLFKRQHYSMDNSELYWNKCHIHIHQNTQIRNDVFELNVLQKHYIFQSQHYTLDNSKLRWNKAKFIFIKIHK